MTTILWLMLWLAGQQPDPLASPFQCVEPTTPVRDAIGAPVGPICATISGVVVRAGSTVVIPNAKITMTLPDSGSHENELIAFTDPFGRFSFPPLNPAGGYHIVAEAYGYIRMAWGQVGNNASGALVSFSDQKKRVITIELKPYTSATGTVRTLDLQPVAAALVRAYRIHYTPIGRRLRIERTTFTNDLGEYRVIWIDPADYYVSASYSDRARTTPTTGTILTPNLSNPDAGYVTEFYAAGTSSADATPFTVLAFGEKTNLNITLKETERFRIRVHVFGTSVLPQRFNVALLPAGADVGDAPDYVVKISGGADFDIPNVGKGRYSLVAFDKSRLLSEVVPLTVDRDLDNVNIPVYDPLDIPGVVVDENGNPISGKLGVRLVRTDPELGQTIRADVDSGSFTVPDVGPGAYDVYVDGLPRGTYIKEVRFPVNDNQYGRIRIEPGRPPRTLDPATLRWRSDAVIQVVLTTSDAIVGGIVWTGARKQGAPEIVPGAQVVLVPDRSPANPYRLREDRFITATADGGGRFRLKGVPPGIYSAFGFVEIPPGLYYDEQFNDRIGNFGTPVIIRDNETVEMTQCGSVGPQNSPCLLRVPREQSIGIAP